MDLPVPDGALAQPTRAQIFSFLVERRAPAGTEEVASHFGLHPNGVRRHLERLEEGGFVVRTRVRGGQGRPRDSWAISPDAHPGGMRPRAYSDLAAWLARAIPDGSFTCTLGNCPYRDSVRENQPIVCGLHRGITTGLLAELDPDRSLAEFEPHDPDAAGCRIAVTAPKRH